MGVEYIYFRQKNSLDRRARTLHIEAWNESYAARVVINEKCRYTVGAPSQITVTCHFPSLSPRGWPAKGAATRDCDALQTDTRTKLHEQKHSEV